MERPAGSEPVERQNVLFVCSGNTCRSPLAEVILRQLARDRGASWIEADSAGTSTVAGQSASRAARQVAEEHGLDLTRKRSQRLTVDRIGQADLILVMEPRHRTDVLNLVPSADERIFVITDLANRRDLAGIADPFAGTIDDYRKCFDDLRSVIADALPRIEERLRRAAPRRGPERT